MYNKQLIQKNKTYGIYHKKKKRILPKNGKAMKMNQKRSFQILFNQILPIIHKSIKSKLIIQKKKSLNRQFNKIKI